MRRYPKSVMVLFAGALFGLLAGITMACGDGGSPNAVTVFVEPSATRTAGADPGTTDPTDPRPTDEPTEPLPTRPPDVEAQGEELPCGDILVAINKQNFIASDCAPTDLVELPVSASWGGTRSLSEPTWVALHGMFEAASAEGVELRVSSGYRSYQEQVATYNTWVDIMGQVEADRTSARAGHSEHQLGTTADLVAASSGYELTVEFGETVEGTWVRENSWRYGFIISYPDGSEPITGYSYEPWHIRFVGVEVAAEVQASGLTLHEFLLAR